MKYISSLTQRPYGAVHLDTTNLYRCQIESEGNLLFNMHNMAQIKSNITERYVYLPCRANLRSFTKNTGRCTENSGDDA